MDFKINLRLNEEFKKNMETYTGTKLATGYVEVNSAFKFPVSVLKKKDDSQMYVKYPDIQDDSGNSKNVVFPVDKELRESLNLAILAELKNNFLKGLDNPEIDSVRVTVLQDELKNGTVAIKGYASIMISGFAINGIVIKETSKGLFVQMPQMKDGAGKYQDIVYGTNALMQSQIKEAVLKKYREDARQMREEKEKNLAEKLQQNTPFVEIENTPKV